MRARRRRSPPLSPLFPKAPSSPWPSGLFAADHPAHTGPVRDLYDHRRCFHVRRQPACPASAEREADPGLLVHLAHGLSARDPARGRTARDQRRGLLPGRLFRHHARRFRRRHRALHGTNGMPTAWRTIHGPGLAQTLACRVFTAMLLSLAGIPLTAGFIAKFYLVAAGVGFSALAAGHHPRHQQRFRPFLLSADRCCGLCPARGQPQRTGDSAFPLGQRGSGRASASFWSGSASTRVRSCRDPEDVQGLR